MVFADTKSSLTGDDIGRTS